MLRNGGIMIFYTTIKRIARLDPTRPAVITPDKVVSYKALEEMIQSFQGRFSVDSKLVVPIVEQDPAVFIALMVGALESGRRVFPIPPTMSKSTYDKIYPLICKAELPIPSEGDVLHLTSGTYGAQKIVVRPIANLEDEASGVANRLCLMSESRVLITTPLAHSFGCGLWRSVICAGSTLYAPTSGDIMTRLIGIRRILKDHSIDSMFGVPYLFRVLARENLSCRNPLVKCFAGGEALTSDIASRWYSSTGLALKQEYGLGEGGIVTLADMISPSNSIGQSLPGLQLKIKDADSMGRGELIVYRSNPPLQYLFGESSETFQSDGGIRTGDIVETDGSDWYFRGRIKSIIVVAGLKAVPSEIEDAIRDLVDVEDVAVIGVKDAITGERPKAFIVPKKRMSSNDVKHLYIDLHRKLDSYKVPKEIRLVQKLPRTMSGKIDRAALKEITDYEKL